MTLGGRIGRRVLLLARDRFTHKIDAVFLVSLEQDSVRTDPRMHAHQNLFPFALSVLSTLIETAVLLLHLDFVTVVTDAVPGEGGGRELCFYKGKLY